MSVSNVFLDANVFVAAVKSTQGGSRLILELAASGKIKIFTVKHALLESERNIKKKLGESRLEIYHQLLLNGRPNIQSISRATLKEINFFSAIVPKKDVPILLGALYSKCPYLITLDRKDFLSNQKLLALNLPFDIVTPGDFLQKYLK